MVASAGAGALPTPRPQASSVDAQVLARFGVFRNQAGPGDAPSAGAFDATRFYNRLYGQNAALARRGLGPSKGVGAITGTWLVPGNKALCVVVVPSAPGVGSVTSCATTTQRAVRQGIVSITGGFGGLQGRVARIYGAMPDSVKAVKVYNASGRARSIPVQNNAFSEIVIDADHVTYTINGKKRSVDVATQRPRSR
jgi:hypothetical protein